MGRAQASPTCFLGLFLGKAYDARDREANARNPNVIIGPSRPTLHGLAGRYAGLTSVDLRRIEGVLAEAGLNFGAVVEFAPGSPPKTAG